MQSQLGEIRLPKLLRFVPQLHLWPDRKSSAWDRWVLWMWIRVQKNCERAGGHSRARSCQTHVGRRWSSLKSQLLLKDIKASLSLHHVRRNIPKLRPDLQLPIPETVAGLDKLKVWSECFGNDYRWPYRQFLCLDPHHLGFARKDVPVAWVEDRHFS
jgi:hypothetical protein